MCVTDVILLCSTEYHREMRGRCEHEMPQIGVKALRLAANLNELVRVVEADKSQRIEALDRVTASQIQMLEFYVDTKDPLAHKHQVSPLPPPRALRRGLRACGEGGRHPNVVESRHPPL